jgi:tetratricopeptide (TPR) repeat protein
MTNPWEILRKTTTDVPAEFRRDAKSTYQVFEILVTEIAKLLERNYTWNVKPVQGDGGIDFIGERLLFDVPTLGVHHRSVIVGQCKARNSGKGRGSLYEFGVDPERMVEAVIDEFETVPTLLILVTSRHLDKEEQRKGRRTHMAVLRAPALYLGRDEIEHVIGSNLESLRHIFDRYLDIDERSVVLKYFESRRGFYEPGVRLIVGAAPSAETGQPFTIPVTLKFDRLVRANDLFLRWNWRERKSRPLMREITPPGIASRQGIQIAESNALERQVNLKLVGYAAGTQDLGSVELLWGERQFKADLGTITLVDAYHPRFFSEPFTDVLEQYKTWLDSTSTGNVHVVAVSGLGGSGKTRLCTEFSYEAERRGARCVTLSHPQTADDPYRLVANLLHTLMPESDRSTDPHEALEKYLSDHHPKVAKKAGTLIESLYPRHTSGPQSIDLTVTTTVLVTLLLDRLSSEMLVLHLSDLHWAHSDVLNILRNAASSVRSLRWDRTARIVFQTRLMLLLEGRRMELNRESVGSSTPGYSTVAWETFAKSPSDPHLDHSVVVEPLTPAQSERFLANIFEGTEHAKTRVPRRLIPHQKTLLSTILARANGSPLYMIEYVRLLRSRQYLATVASTGLVYLSRRIDSTLAAPTEIDRLIQRRLDYVHDGNPGLATLIRAVAFIKDRVPVPLFELLKKRFAPRTPIATIAETDFLLIPSTRVGDVSFRHESYYEALQSTALDPRDRDAIAKIYLRWLSKQPADSAEVLFERGLVLSQLNSPNRAAVERVLATAFDRAERAKKVLLIGRILRHLVDLYPGDENTLQALSGAEFIRHAEYRGRLIRSFTDAANWIPARAEIEQLLRIVESDAAARLTSDTDRDRLLLLAAEADIQLANIEFHQLRHDLSIGLLRDQLASVRRPRTRRREVVDRWNGIRRHAENRLGVALWFDGQYDEAVNILTRGFRAGREAGDPRTIYWHVDAGAVMMHRDPVRALAMLDRAVRTAPDSRASAMAEYERGMAELLMLERSGGVHRHLSAIETLARRMERVHEISRHHGFTNEEGGAALVAGVCMALLGCAEAAEWFMRVITVAGRDSHYEFLWKAHLNLAQLCLDKQEFFPAADLHAQEAERILRMDLNRRSDTTLPHRLALLALPLAQLHRVWVKRDVDRARQLRVDFPIAEGFVTRKRRNEAGIVHVSRGESDFFLIS